MEIDDGEIQAKVGSETLLTSLESQKIRSQGRAGCPEFQEIDSVKAVMASAKGF